MRKLIVPAALLAVGAIIAGCGSSDSSSTTALSKSEFTSKANAICKKGNAQIKKEAQKTFSSGQQPSAAQQKKFITDTAIPTTQSQIDEIGNLTPPSGDEDQVNAILDAAQKATDEVKKDPTLATQQGSQDPFAQADKLAKAYGLTTCASG